MASAAALFRLRARELFGLEQKFIRLTPRQTLARVAREPIGVSRYGDGELRYALKRKALKFQPFREGLADRLLAAVLTPRDGVLTCFNNTFRDSDVHERIRAYSAAAPERTRSALAPDDIAVYSRRSERLAYSARWTAVASRTAIRTFGDAIFVRLYVYVAEYKAGAIEAVKDDFRRLFAGRRILFVGPRTPLWGPSFRDLGEELRALGVAAAEFVDVPPVDAAAEEERIVRAILAARGMTDVFIQAGPLATVLAHELAGRTDARILDAGSLNAQVPYLL